MCLSENVKRWSILVGYKDVMVLGSSYGIRFKLFFNRKKTGRMNNNGLLGYNKLST